MNENTIQILAGLKILLLAVFAYLYGRGGISHNVIRRWIGTAILTAGIVGFSLWQGTFHWLYLAYYPLLSGSLTLPYGASTTWGKILKRFLYGAACATAALPLVFGSPLDNPWLPFGWHVALCLQASIILGVWNPFQARDEETLIATFSTIIPLFII